MNPTDLDLRGLTRQLGLALEGYRWLFDNEFHVQDFPDLALTPEKPNSARTVVPIKYGFDLRPLDMYAIVFLPGDGTGDSKTYKAGELKLPSRLKYEEKPERVLPRSKNGVICEGFFPFFSVGSDGRAKMFDAYMEELIVTDATSPSTVVHGWGLGRGGPIPGESKNAPRVYFTTGEINGKRFGDPHAVHYPKEYSNGIQVAGFLAVKDTNHPILGATEKWILPMSYR